MENNGSDEEMGKWEKIHIFLGAAIFLLLFGGFFGYLFYIGLWISLD